MEISTIFCTPFWQSEYPQFEEEKDSFLKFVKEFQEKVDSVHKSNHKGYQSPIGIQSADVFSGLFEYVCQMAYKAIIDLDFIDCNVAITSAWFNNNNTKQCMNTSHIHSDVFAGVFYLKCPEGSGRLVIDNPGINKLWTGCELTSQKNLFTGESIKVIPEEGSIVLFPSYLPHSVETNDHDDERISISFNITVFPIK